MCSIDHNGHHIEAKPALKSRRGGRPCPYLTIAPYTQVLCDGDLVATIFADRDDASFHQTAVWRDEVPAVARGTVIEACRKLTTEQDPDNNLLLGCLCSATTASALNQFILDGLWGQ